MFTYSFLEETKLQVTKESRKAYDGFRRKARDRILVGNSFKCAVCKKTLTKNEATIDHIIPNIIINASFGKIKHRYRNTKISCYKCNHGNKIHSSIGALFRSNNIKEIKEASTHLCNLVRPNLKRRLYDHLFDYITTEIERISK